MVFITVREASVRSQSARHQQRVERTRQQAALLSRFAARTYRDAKTTQQELVREDMRQAWLKEKSDTVSTLRNAQSLARTLHGCSRRAAQAYTAELSHIAKDTAKRWDQYETLVQKRAALGATYFRAEGVINDAGARQRVERIQQVREREDRRAKMITEGVTRIRDGRATDDPRPAGVRRSSSAGVASFPGGVYRVEWASSSARTISARRRAEEVAHKLQADQEARRTQDAERNYKAVVRGRSSLHALYVQAEERRNLEHAEELERARKEKKVREITRDPLVVDFMDREVRRSQNLSRCLHREFQRTFLFPESGWHVPKDEPPATSRIAPVHYMDPCTKSQSAVASHGPLSGQGGSEATLLSMPLPESDQSSLDKSGEPLLLYDVLPYSNPPEGETATLSMLLNQESK